MGKKLAPFYRIVVLGSRKKHDGRIIEEIGIYDPVQESSFVSIDPERVQYWLGAGVQPSDAVYKLTKVTGDYHQFKGLKDVESTFKAKDADAAAVAKGAAVRAAVDDAEKRKTVIVKTKADEEVAESKIEESIGDQTPGEAAVEET